MALKSYSPRNVTISGDSELLTSWQSATVEYDEDRWGFSEAATGEVTRTRHEGKLGTITIVLPQTSTDNEAVNTLTLEQDATEVGDIPPTIALTIKDNWGTSLHSIPEATLVKKPSCEFSMDPSDREWVFKGEIDNHTVGGNS